jgi:hypothetical protein
VKPTDITNDEAFITIASKSVTAPSTYYMHTRRHGSTFKSVDSAKVMQNDKIRIAQNKVMAQQRDVSRLCKEMLSIWEFISIVKPKASSKMLKAFLTIDEDKIQLSKSARNASAESAEISKITGTGEASENAKISETIETAETSQVAFAQPATLLSTPQQDTPVQPATPQDTSKERKLEYLYTLFDALLQCTEAAFGLTRVDLAQAMVAKVDDPSSEVIIDEQ